MPTRVLGFVLAALAGGGSFVACSATASSDARSREPIALEESLAGLRTWFGEHGAQPRALLLLSPT